MHPDDLPEVERAVAGAIDPASDGRFLSRYRVLSRDGALRHVEATGRVLFREGKAPRLVGTVRDITAEIAAAEELEKARRFAENLIQSAPTLLYIYDLVERRNVFIGSQIGPLTNMGPDDYAALGSTLIPAVIHPDDVARVGAHHEAIRERRIEPPFEIDYRLRRADDGWVWLSSREVVHARDAEGKPTQILGASVDITQRREAEALRELVVGEMGHRIKNLMGVVQSVARQTLRHACDPDAWIDFERRLAALAAAQHLLTDGDWRSAELEDVVRVILRPFNSDDRRINLRGPSASIAGAQVATLALALHELATNAVKHGALSVPQGRVEVVWSSEGELNALEWRETGGPPVKPPARHGFGARMINALARPQDCDRWRFDPDGVRCRLTF